MTEGHEGSASSSKEHALTRGKRGPRYGLYTLYVLNVTHQNERPPTWTPKTIVTVRPCKGVRSWHLALTSAAPGHLETEEKAYTSSGGVDSHCIQPSRRFRHGEGGSSREATDTKDADLFKNMVYL